jgi:S-adenosylmethionine/arginine decarboxylase-like enzyme
MCPFPTKMWGKHLIMDIARCAPLSIRSSSNIYRFTKDLVKKIDMVAYGEPQIVMFGSGNKKGYTLVQLIETSNITAHFVEETNDMYLDVFSCKDFDEHVVAGLIANYFSPENLESRIVTRQAEVVWRG